MMIIKVLLLFLGCNEPDSNAGLCSRLLPVKEKNHLSTCCFNGDRSTASISSWFCTKFNGASLKLHILPYKSLTLCMKGNELNAHWHVNYTFRNRWFFQYHNLWENILSIRVSSQVSRLPCDQLGDRQTFWAVAQKKMSVTDNATFSLCRVNSPERYQVLLGNINLIRENITDHYFFFFGEIHQVTTIGSGDRIFVLHFDSKAKDQNSEGTHELKLLLWKITSIERTERKRGRKVVRETRSI